VIDRSAVLMENEYISKNLLSYIAFGRCLVSEIKLCDRQISSSLLCE